MEDKLIGVILNLGNFRIFGTGGGTKSLEDTSGGDDNVKYFWYVIGNTAWGGCMSGLWYQDRVGCSG